MHNPTPHSSKSGARPLRALFGLATLALALAACTAPPAVPDFSLSFSGSGAADGTVEIEQGASLVVTVDIDKSGGFDELVTLSSNVTTAQASGIQVTFDDDTVRNSATMTIDVGAGVDFNDDYTVTVSGRSGSINRSATLTIDVTEDTTPVPDFSLSFSGGGAGDGTVEIEQGTSLDVTVDVQASGGFAGVVTLSSGVTTAQVAGIDVSFDPATTGTSSTMTIDVGAGVDFNDDYTLTVTGTSGSISSSATLTIDVTETTVPVGSIDLTADTTDLTLVQSSDRDVTLTVTPAGGFSGDVDLGFNDAGSGIVGTFGTDPVTVNAAATSTLTLAAGGSVTPGVYTVTVTATAGTLTDSVDLEVRVITASAVRYINADSGNDTTGDGSAGNPLATIAQALTDLGGTGTIFLQAATASYDGGFTLTADLTLEGTGADEGDAVIAGAVGNGILLQGGTVTLRNLTIDGFENGIRNNSGTTTLTIDRVTIDGSSEDGLTVSTVGTTLTLDATDLTLTGIGGDAISLGNNLSATGPSITATFTNLIISGGAGEAMDFKGSNALDVTIDNAAISNAGDGGIELDSGVASGASFVMRNSSVTGSAGIGMVIEAFGATTIDIASNNTISGSGGVELRDNRVNGDATVIAAGGLTLNATDPTGTATGADSDGDLWEIIGDGNQIDFD